MNAKFFINKLSELLSLVPRNRYVKNIMCGHVNLDMLNYENIENPLNLFNSLVSQSLIPVITKPSRITDETATLIK